MLRSRLGRKGQAPSQTTLIIFAFAVLIAFTAFFKLTTHVVEAQDAVQGCHLSAKLSSWEIKKDLWVADWSILDSPFSLNCKTLVTEVKKDAIVRAGYDEKLSDDPLEREEQLKESIMSHMAECWYMYGEGQFKIHQVVETDDEKTTCIVCSEIVPDKDIVDANIVLSGMYAYADSNNAPPPNSDKTYLGYFLEGADRSLIDLAKLDKDIHFNQQYSVVFAIADQADDPLFNKDIKPGTGVVDCYLGGYADNPVSDGSNAEAIGCNSGNDKPVEGVGKGESPGLVFGRVIDGGTDVELLNWRDQVPGAGGDGDAIEQQRFPMTVRLVPTKNLVNYCYWLN